MPYSHAQDEVEKSKYVRVGEKTVRDTTVKSGRASEMVAQEEVKELERLAPEPTSKPEKVLFSNDGAFIHLVTGEWREVKTLAIGEFDTETNRQGEEEVKTTDISYFSRTYTAREFECFSLIETHRRGVENAELVAAVNDGAEWIQNTIDHHAPDAIRILDFPHAQEYMADAGKASMGADSEDFTIWFKQASHDLKHKGPKPILEELRNLHQLAHGKDKTQEVISDSIAYLDKRKQMLDYPSFRASHLPIGSGSVESAHKVVMQSRMKQAGMRWKDDNIDPMLALRCLLSNDRWDEGWDDILDYRLQLRQRVRQHRSQLKRASQIETLPVCSPAPVVEHTPKSEPTTQQLTAQAQPYRPADDHPWRKPFFNRPTSN